MSVTEKSSGYFSGLAGGMPPGPRGRPVVGVLPRFASDPLTTLTDNWRRYGDVVRLPFTGSLSPWLLAHPDQVKHVLQDNHFNYRKVPFTTGKLKEILGEGLLTSEGSLWLRQRRLVQPAFHRQRLATFGAMMTDATNQMLEHWAGYAASGLRFDVAREMMELTLTIISRAMFSTDVQPDAEIVGDAVEITQEHVNRRMMSYVDLPLSLPLPRNRRFLAAMASLDRIVYRFIEERRRSSDDPGDLLSMLLSVRDEETGERMSDRQIRDEVMTIFLAGHETTSVALSWTWYLLSKNPAAGRRLRAELRQVLGGRTPTIEDLAALSYTRMVIEESMRLYPPAWIVTRQSIGEDQVGPYRIPPGTSLFLSPWVTQRHPDFWDNPEGFDPERFAPESNPGHGARFAYFPFGGGPRQCIGNNFAMLEAQLILATIAQAYEIELVPDWPIALQPLITLRPRHGIGVTLRSTN